MDVTEIFKTMSYGPAPESPAAVDAWLNDHVRQFGLFINNQWVDAKNKPALKSFNPATGEVLASVANADVNDIDSAVKCATDAFKKWSKTPGHIRARYMYAIARNIQKHARLLAVVESMDNGKSIRESRDLDIPLVARHFYYHAGWAQLMESELADYQPVGVVGQVIPWNFPLLMLAWKVAPAIALGNTLVIKPAPSTMLSALLFAEILVEAGLPPGVVNIVTGDDETGAAIVNHNGFDKIAFTGSTQVGRILRRATAGTGKRLSLELGGKSPFVVFEDADLDGAIEGLVDAIWFNQGQVCCAGSRLLVQESIAARFIPKLKARMATLRIGDSLDKAIDIGAVVDQNQWNTIDGWVKLGVKEGSELFQPDIPLPEEGCFYPPTLLTNVAANSSVVQEEIFGPVLVAMTFRTPPEAVELANNTRYGLAASVWSENINLAIDVARQIKAGSLWINSTNLFDAASGFGGYRESGFGREGGREGLHEYMRPKWQKRPRPNAVPGEHWGQAVPSRPMLLNGTGKHEQTPSIDRTAKMYIGGKQARPDGNYTRIVCGVDGRPVGQVSDGNRKDIRNAVEAARKAEAGWANRNGHNRAQIIYYIAENLAAREREFIDRIVAMTGCKPKDAQAEFEAALSRLFTYAAYADKYGGTVQETPMQGLTVALNEPIGTMAAVCPDDYPLLGFVSMVAPIIARGNTVVVVPSERHPLCATDFYQILETSDVPAGVVNIVTGDRDHLSKTLVEHDQVDAMWYFGSAEGSYHVEYASASNMKRTWVGYGEARDWLDPHQGEGEEFLMQSTQVKNIWVPSGE